MGQAAEAIRTTKQTTLQRTLTTALNELGVEAALVGIYEREGGSLVAQGSRGFSPREIQTVLRTLSGQESSLLTATAAAGEEDSHRALRLRMITPAAKSLLAMPLRHKQRLYGILVIGRKESVSFSKKEKSLIESAGEEITGALERAALFDGTLLLAAPLVVQEPAPTVAPAGPAALAPSSYATPEVQERIAALLSDQTQTVPFDRAWVTSYDPIAGAVEVLGLAGDYKGELKKDLKPGQRLALDSSASGWAVRHRKPRVDNDLASTQGRFLDHKHLFKDRFRSSLVVPFFVRGQVGGTVTLASRTPTQYGLPDARALEPLIVKVVELLQEPLAPQAARAQPGVVGEPQAEPPPQISHEPLIRKQERQAALGEFSAFLATEIREPLASIRVQLEEVTGEGILDFDPQTRVENAMRDLIRIEAILNEILDFAKPLELNRRLCRVPDIIENMLTVVGTELDMNRTRVTKDYAANLPQVRCDEAKMQQVFLSIFKNSLEAMTPGGHLHIEVTQQKSGRTHDVQITIKNDGAPIPTEHVGKVFEPFFTTKRAGTGLGLATVKKIVEEHQGQISIASGPGQGTTVIIRLPPPVHRGGPYRRRGRGRRPPRNR
ncbi:MAG: GAF domain-containing protein [Nitrospira sp.]|nr:GAF domain-containing protein [Nitrospira sp.]